MKQDFLNKKLNLKERMISDLETLEANKDKMRCKMEMMLMSIQTEFCRALENEEDPRYTS